MASWGEGAARGLESGFRLAMDVNSRQQQEARQDRQDQRQAGLDQQTQTDRALAQQRQVEADQMGALTAQGQLLTAEGQANAASKVPLTPEQQQDYTRRSEGHAQSVQALLIKRGAYDPAKVQAEAKVDGEALARGDLTDFKTGKASFTKTVMGATGIAPPAFRPDANGNPGPVEQGVKDFQEGMESGDHDRLINGANVLFAPEVNKGIGGQGAQGGTIVGKRIVNMVPDPNSTKEDPRWIPTLRVYVNNGKAEASGDEMRARRNMDPNAPPGATGHYDAPMTQGRSSDPNDKVKSISGNDAMQRVGHLSQMVDLMKGPEADELLKVDSQSSWDPNRYAQALARQGVKTPGPTVEEFTQKPGEVRVRRLRDKDGNVIAGSETRDVGPEKQFRTGSTQEKIDAIDSMVEDGTLTADEGAARKRTLAATVTEPGKAGGLGAGSDSLDLKVRNERRAELKDKFQRAKDMATGAAADLHAFDTLAKDWSGTQRKDPANIARRAALAKAADATRTRMLSLNEELDKPLDAPTTGLASGNGGNVISPADQATRDLDGGKLILAESGGASTAPARLAKLREAAASAKQGGGRGAGETAAIITQQADMLEGAMRAAAGAPARGAAPASPAAATPAAPAAANKSGPAIAALPKGAKQIGTSGGKKVFQTPDGKKFVED